MRPLIKHWRGQGLRAIIYLDDGIVAVNGEAAAKSASSQVRAELVMAGLIEHTAKCIWTPTTQMGWLGFDLDLSKGVISVPKTKLDALYKQLEEAAKRETIQARCLASIIGKIISMSLGLGPVARLQTRSMYAVLNSRQSWCQFLRISHETKMELRFWLGQLKCFNGQNIWHSPSAIRVVYSDASDTGYGGYVVEHGCHIAQGQWLPHEARLSSTWQELQAVLKVLQSLTSKLQNQRIRWFTDNQNVVRILSVGSKNSLLQQEAIAIFNNSIRNQVRIEPEWILREANQQAAVLWTVTIGAYALTCLKSLMPSGALILWIDLLTVLIHNYLGLAHDFGTQGQKLLTHLLVIGRVRTIGGVRQYV